MLSVTLPWPPVELKPNARVHWSAKSRAAKAYKEACWAMTKKAIHPEWANRPDFADGPIKVDIEFVEPDRRARDMDNMLAAIKSGLDGLALALQVNDRRFELTIRRSPAIGGMVRVTLS